MGKRSTVMSSTILPTPSLSCFNFAFNVSKSETKLEIKQKTRTCRNEGKFDLMWNHQLTCIFHANELLEVEILLSTLSIIHWLWREVFFLIFDKYKFVGGNYRSSCQLMTFSKFRLVSSSLQESSLTTSSQTDPSWYGESSLECEIKQIAFVDWV